MMLEQKMAALSGLMTAVAVSLAFFGEDWRLVWNHFSRENEPEKRPAEMILLREQRQPSPEQKVDRQTLHAAGKTGFPKIRNPLEHPAVSGRSGPVKSEMPGGPAGMTADRRSLPAESPLCLKKAAPSSGSVRMEQMSLSIGGTADQFGFFRPYFYQCGELISRIPEETGRSENPEKEKSGDYCLHQSVRHDGKSLRIVLALDFPEQDRTRNSAVIFTQKIPDGWTFAGEQGGPGWYMIKDRMLKILASSEKRQGPLRLELPFVQERAGAPLPRVERAVCAVQQPDGCRRICCAEL